ncbi:zinc metalloprotease [Luteitalea sp. TBR-22]|uniref:M48 family metallopeptidase n=1 Tax=Luteitalea sp. TBR-22 TaxID=2802971 RepID=UPI001AF1B867|nr:SprT family zinc-dependent metalloprotease [Luteitalea sp. TBR-22]BCS32862.1 zinc metalloprotease [Luteitalea sp. TBR-22]
MSRPAQLSFPWRECAERDEAAPMLAVAPSPAMPSPALTFVRNGRARRYILRVLPDATVRVTIPRYGSRREAEAFVRTRTRWIDERRQEIAGRRHDLRWRQGQRIWWRGLPVILDVAQVDATRVVVRCGDLVATVPPRDDYRPVIEPLMRARAAAELPPRLLAFAARHDLTVSRVTVRSQRSRWGSCSRDGSIALNWRLLQMPAEVCDYVLLHELMHLRQPNHSPRFWAEVAAVCPDYATSRAWLRAEGLGLC